MIRRWHRQALQRWQLVLLFLLIPFSGYSQAASAGDELQRINAIKAAFVLNIARFVTWPQEIFSSDDDPIHLCVYRDAVYGNVMKNIDGKTIGHRRLHLSTVQHLETGQGCEVLLIPSSTSSEFSAELKGKLTQPLLTIADQTESDDNKMSRNGIIVTLVRQGSRIAFEIDPWQAKHAHLHMSSELLKLAKIVGEEQ